MNTSAAVLKAEEARKIQEITRRLEQGVKRLEKEKRELKAAQKKLKKQQRRLEQQQKQLRNREKRLERDREEFDRRSTRSSRKSTGLSPTGASNFSPRSSMFVEGSAKWKEKYDRESKVRRDLHHQVGELKDEVKFLRRQSTRINKVSAPDMSMVKKVRGLHQEMQQHVRKLRSRIVDVEKTGDYFRAQTRRFKTQQNKWIKKQKQSIKQNVAMKYVWADDVKRIELRGSGKESGFKVWTKDGHEAHFLGVDVDLLDRRGRSRSRSRGVSPHKNGAHSSGNIDMSLRVDDYWRAIKADRQLGALLDDEDDEEEIYQIVKGDLDASTRSIVKPLLGELTARAKDLKRMQKAMMQGLVDEEPLDEKDDSSDNQEPVVDAYLRMLESIENRHRKFRNAHSGTEVLSMFIDDNIAWYKSMQTFPVQMPLTLRQELGDRLRDVKHVSHIAKIEKGGGTIQEEDEKQSKLTQHDETVLPTTLEQLVSSIQDRHDEMMDGWSEEQKIEWFAQLEDLADANTSWRREVILATHESSRVPPFAGHRNHGRNVSQSSAITPLGLTNVPSATLSLPKKLSMQSSSLRVDLGLYDEEDDLDIDVVSEYAALPLASWWLLRADWVIKYMQSLAIQDAQRHQLCQVAQYFNCILESADVGRDYKDLYVPISLYRCHLDCSNPDLGHIGDLLLEDVTAYSLLDGVVFCLVIGLIFPGMIDLRAVHRPSEDNKTPLREVHMRENMTLVFSCFKSLGLSVPQWEAGDFFTPGMTVEIMLAVAEQLFRAHINSIVCVDRYPELLRLCQSDSEIRRARGWTSKEWLHRWMMYLANPVVKRHRKQKSSYLDSVIAISPPDNRRNSATLLAPSTGGGAAGDGGGGPVLRSRPRSRSTSTPRQSLLTQDKVTEHNEKTLQVNGLKNPPLQAPTKPLGVQTRFELPQLSAVGNSSMEPQVPEIRTAASDTDEPTPRATSLGRARSSMTPVARGGPGAAYPQSPMTARSGSASSASVIMHRNLFQDVVTALEKADPLFSSRELALLDDPFTEAELILKHATEIGVNTSVTADHIADRRMWLLELLLANIFECKNYIQPLSSKEKKAMTSLFRKKSSENEAILSWVNALGISRAVKNLNLDISNGLVLLEVLDKVKPYSVEWGSVRRNVRNKFDRIGNCNYAIQLCREKFDFHLVGIAGADIVDGNEKYIQSLFWQLMLFDSAVKLRALFTEELGEKRSLTPDDVLQLANEAVRRRRHAMRSPSGLVLANGHGHGVGVDDDLELGLDLGDEDDSKELLPHARSHSHSHSAHSLRDRERKEQEANLADMTSFSDPRLTSCTWYFELLQAVCDVEVDDELVLHVPAIPHRMRKKDKHTKERLTNARLLLSLVRRMGGDVFIKARDLCSVNQQSALNIVASIMTIGYSASDNTVLL